MITLLYGSDSYRRINRLKELIRGYKNKYPHAAFGRFDFFASADNGGQPAFTWFEEFISGQSLFSDKKIAVLENIWSFKQADKKRVSSALMRRGAGSRAIARDSAEQKSGEKNSSFTGELKKYLKANLSLENSILIISEPKKPPADWKFLLKEPVHIEEFEELSGKELKTFLKKEIEGMSMSLSPEALEFLLGFYESDLWGLMTELEKLRWLAPGVSSISAKGGSAYGGKYQVSGERIVDLEAVKRTGDYSESQNIFHFLDAVENRDGWPEKLKELEKLFIGREEPAKIFNFLASRNHPPEFLEKLADYDIMVKSGKMDYEEVLLDLILR